MSNAALAFFSGLAGGYVKGKQDEDEKARRDKRDAREQEEHDARMAELAKKNAADKALRDAATPATVSTGATVNGISANPTVYDNVDVASSDVRQANKLAQGGMPGQEPAAAAGMAAAGSTAEMGAPAAAPATMTPAPVVNGTAYPSQAGAQAAADAANTPQAVRTRQIAALRGVDPERADRMEATGLTLENARAEQARKLRDEGVFDGLRAFRAGDAAGMKEALNKSGQYKIDGDVTLTPEVREVPGVGKITTYNATFNAVGPDGKVVPRQVNSHDLSMQMMPYEKALDLQQKGTKEQREGRETDAKVKRDEAYAEYLTGAKSDAERARAEGNGKAAKMDEADRITLQNVNKQRDLIQGEIVKAQAGGMWDENAPNAKALRKQLAALDIREQQVLGKYVEAPAADPVGLRKPAAAPKATSGPASTKVSASEQAGRDRERRAILDAELAKAKARLAAGDQRAQGDIDAVTKELQRMGAAPKLKPAAATSSGIQAPPAPQGKTTQAPAPAAVSPTEAAGQRLDAARTVLKTLRATAPGLAKGRAALEAHAQQVQAAQAELAAAEAEYQRIVTPHAGRAYFGGHPQPAAMVGGL